MITSSDVSALFAAQQQGFATGNYYANTIGISNPNLNIGAVGWGAGQGGMRPVPGGVPGLGAPPPVFSYAGGGPFGPGYGPGAAFGGTVMSGIGAAATAGGVALGLGTMFGPAPMRALGPLIDPISGFLAAGPRIPLLNPAGTGSIMSGLAGAVPGALLAGGASVAMGQMMHGAHQQQMISQQLGQFNFINPASRTGMGFNRQDAMDIGTMIRSLSNIPDMLTSVEELTRMLPQMRRMGVMQGVRDSAEFSRRFKETISTIRDMSKMLGSTMEEAAQFFEHSRSLGFTSRQAQLQNVLQTQFTSAMTGMSMGETMGMEQRGAAFARQRGARGTWGVEAVRNLVQRIHLGRERGTIAEGVMTEFGEGPQGEANAAERLMGLMDIAMQGPAGQLLQAGFLKRGAKGGWEFDREAMDAFNRGEMGIDEVKRRAASLGRAGKMAFKGPGGRNLRMAVAGNLDIRGLSERLVPQYGEEGAKLFLQNYLFGGQAGEPDIELTMGLAGTGESQDRATFEALRAREMEIRQRTDPAILWEKIKTRASARLFAGLRQTGAGILDWAQRSYENFVDDIVDRTAIQLDKQGAQAFRQAMGGNDPAYQQMVRQAQSLRVPITSGGLGADARRSGAWQAINLWASGGTGSGLGLIDQGRIMGGIVGRSQTGAAAFLRNVEAGYTQTAQGAAAAGALAGVQARAIGAEGYRDSDPITQFRRQQEAVVMEIARGMLPGRSQEQVEGLARVLNAGNYGMLWAITGKTLEQHRAAMAGTPAGQLLEAGLAARGAHGISNLGAGVLFTTPQRSGLRPPMADLLDPQALAQKEAVRNLSAYTRDADSDVAKALPETGNIVRDKPHIRAFLNSYFNADGPTQNGLRVALAEGNEEVLRSYGLSVEDARDAERVLAEAESKGSNARGAIGKKYIAAIAADVKAVGLKVQQLGGAMADSAAKEKGLGAASQKALSILSAALKAYDPLNAKFGDIEKGERGDIGKGIMGLAAAYAAASPAEQAAIRRIVGPTMAGAMRSLASGGRRLLKEKSITEAAIARDFGLSAEDVSGLGLNLGAGAANTPELRARIMEAVGGLKGVGEWAAPGATTGAEKPGGILQEITNTLANINKQVQDGTSIQAAMMNKLGMKVSTPTDGAKTNKAAPAGTTSAPAKGVVGRTKEVVEGFLREGIGG